MISCNFVFFCFVFENYTLDLYYTCTRIVSFCDAIPFAEYTFSFSLGYFLWDAMCIYRHWEFMKRVAWIAHCILAIFVFIVPVTRPYFHREAAFGLCYEISSVFLYLFQLCEEKNYTKCTIINQIIFVITFTFVRIILGTYVYFQTFDALFFNQYFFGDGSKININHMVDTSIPSSGSLDNNECVSFFAKCLCGIVLIGFYCLNLVWFKEIVRSSIDFVKGKEKYHNN